MHWWFKKIIGGIYRGAIGGLIRERNKKNNVTKRLTQEKGKSII